MTISQFSAFIEVLSQDMPYAEKDAQIAVIMTGMPYEKVCALSEGETRSLLKHLSFLHSKLPVTISSAYQLSELPVRTIQKLSSAKTFLGMAQALGYTSDTPCLQVLSHLYSLVQSGIDSSKKVIQKTISSFSPSSAQVQILKQALSVLS